MFNKFQTLIHMFISNQAAKSSNRQTDKKIPFQWTQWCKQQASKYE